MSCHLTGRPGWCGESFIVEAPEKCLEPQGLWNLWSHCKQTLALLSWESLPELLSWWLGFSFVFSVTSPGTPTQGVFSLSLFERKGLEGKEVTVRVPVLKWNAQTSGRTQSVPNMSYWGKRVLQALLICVCDSHSVGRAWGRQEGQREEAPKRYISFSLPTPFPGESWEGVTWALSPKVVPFQAPDTVEWSQVVTLYVLGSSTVAPGHPGYILVWRTYPRILLAALRWEPSDNLWKHRTAPHWGFPHMFWETLYFYTFK